MITIKKQYYGIKFPFTANNVDGFFLDLNAKPEDKIASEIAHVLLTPKGSRLRKPDFGTDVIKYVFDSNLDATWDNIVREAREGVEKYVPNTSLNNMEVIQPENDDHTYILHFTYSVKKGNTIENNEMAIKL